MFPVGEELNVAIAELVMGEPCPTEDMEPFSGLTDWPVSAGGNWIFRRVYEHGDVPEWHPQEFSIDIRAAWLVVEKLCADGWELELCVWDDGTTACFIKIDEFVGRGAASLAPLAICRAAYEVACR